MAERSFVEEVKKLRLGDGELFRGEGILAVTKALLESGVNYVAGYQGAPISHLMDVLADAQDILSEYGIRFESSASEATAAATLAAQYFPSEVVFSPSVSPLFSQLTSSLAVRALQKRQQKIDHPAS